MCTTDGRALTRTILTHVATGETDVKGHPIYRTRDGGMTCLRPRIWLNDEVIWQVLVQWARRHWYGYNSHSPAQGARSVWIGDTFTYTLDAKGSKKERR